MSSAGILSIPQDMLLFTLLVTFFSSSIVNSSAGIGSTGSTTLDCQSNVSCRSLSKHWLNRSRFVSPLGIDAFDFFIYYYY